MLLLWAGHSDGTFPLHLTQSAQVTQRGSCGDSSFTELREVTHQTSIPVCWNRMQTFKYIDIFL